MRLKGVGRLVAPACAALLLAVGLLTVAGCGTVTSYDVDNEENAHITLGVTSTCYQGIAQAAQDKAAELGLTVDVVTYGSTQEATDALDAGEVDATLCSDIYYLNAYDEANDTDLTSKQTICFVKMGLFSSTVKSLDDLPQGATVAVPNSASYLNRVIRLLADAGVLTLDEASPTEVTEDYIATNPKGITFVQVDEEDTSALVAEGAYDLVAVKGNYALDAGLSMDDALAVETGGSQAAWRHADVLAVRNNGEAVLKYDKYWRDVLRSTEVSEYLTETYGEDGAVVAVFVTE